MKRKKEKEEKTLHHGSKVKVIKKKIEEIGEETRRL